jgi:hypothetical protein
MNPFPKVNPKFALMPALLLCIAMPAMAGEWKVGHIIVGIPGGQIQVLDSFGNIIDGTSTTGISLTTGGRVAGCAPDSTYRVRCVDYDNAKVVKFALQDPHAPTQTLSLSTGSHPQSLLYIGVNNDVLLGFAGGTVTRYDYTGSTLQKNCTGLAVDAASTFWMDAFTSGSTAVYTSGVAQNGKAKLRSVNLSNCNTASLFTLNLSSGQAFYGVRALPNTSTGLVDGTGGYIIALGSDILRVNQSGSPIKCYISGTLSAVCPSSFTGVDGASNNWRALWLTPDGQAFWTVNLVTGNLFEFNVTTGARLAGPINTAASATDVVAGITVEGAGDAALPVVQTQTLSLTQAMNTGSACFYDMPSSCTPSATPQMATPQANQVAVTLNGLGSTDAAFVKIRFTEIGQNAGTSDTGLPCALLSVDGSNCVVYDIEASGTFDSNTTIGNLLLYSPQRANHPILLQNEALDFVAMIAQDEYVRSGGGCCKSVYSDHELPTQTTFLAGGWETPITDMSNPETGGSISTKFVVFNNGVAVPTTSFNCNTTNFETNCPELSITMLQSGQAPAIIVPIGGNTGSSGTAVLFFRPGGDGITWVVTVDTTGLLPGCYIFTGKDPQERFFPFSYSTTTAPLTSILRIGSKSTLPSISTCQSLAAQAGIVGK